MKIRQGFVSNSSSSSFVIKTRYISDDMLESIKNWRKLAAQLPCPYNRGEKVEVPSEYDNDDWDITFGADEILFATNQDNFDMRWFLDQLGMPMEHLEMKDW